MPLDRLARLRRQHRPIAIALAAIVTSLEAGALAAEPTKEACVDANTRAQSLRREGKLGAAKASLRVCVAASCPAIVRDDCAERLDAVERALPTIVFDAKDAAGKDAVNVKVTVDGQPFADKLDGTALPIDPGEHDLVFVIAGQPPIKAHLVVHEGEKGRHERIGKEAAPGAATSRGSAPVDPSAGATQRTAGIVTGAVGIVGLGVGVAFGASASSKWSSSQAACPSATDCPNHDLATREHDGAVTAGTVSTIAFIGGGALLAGGIALWLTAPRANRERTTGALEWLPSASPGGASMTLRRSF